MLNVFVQIVKCICREACHLVCSTAPFGKSTFHNTHSAWVIFFPDLPDNQSYLRGSSGGQKVVCQQRTFKTWTTNSILNWPQKQRLGFQPSLTCTWCVCLYSASFVNYCHKIVIKRWLASKERFKYAQKDSKLKRGALKSALSKLSHWTNKIWSHLLTAEIRPYENPRALQGRTVFNRYLGNG